MWKNSSILNVLHSFPSIPRHYRQTYVQTNEQDKTENLDNFIRILMHMKTNSTLPILQYNDTNSSINTNFLLDVYNKMPNFMASIFQLFTLIFVCLFCLCICKCNKMMDYFKRLLTNSSASKNDIYKDKMTFFDYIWFTCRCYRFKKRASFKKFQHNRIKRSERSRNNRFNRQTINIRENSEKRILRNNSIRKKTTTPSNQQRSAFVNYTKSIRSRNIDPDPEDVVPQYNSTDRISVKKPFKLIGVSEETDL
jgi:hypothetical protein